MTRSCPVSRRRVLRVGAGVPLLVAGLVSVTPQAFSQEAPPPSEMAKETVALVDKAAALAGSEGEAAFSEFRKPGSEWLTGDTYLFVIALNGIFLFHGAIPKLEGTSGLGLKDSDGKPFVVEFIKMAQSKGSGWVHYMWPKPGQSQPSEKWSYVKAVTIEGTPALVAAGFYPS